MTNEDETVSFTKSRRAMARIKTPEDFYDFLEIFEEDIGRDGEFSTLLFQTGIDGMATFLYKNEDMPQEPDWKLFAEILIRGMNHA